MDPKNLTPDQIKQLQDLGIDTKKYLSKPSRKLSKPVKKPESSPPHQVSKNTISTSSPISTTPNKNLSTPPRPIPTLIPSPAPPKISPSNSKPSPKVSAPTKNTPIKPKTTIGIKPKKSPIFPLLSISGITLLSFGTLILLKSKSSTTPTPENIPLPDSLPNSQSQNQPTQVPKSIQHYLLASQQYFSQALQLQQNSTDPDQQNLVNLLNQSILAASDAVNNFPQDHRGYFQRARIYQGLADSQPQYLDSAINDLKKARQLNLTDPQITRDLASLFAKKGDTQNTISYLEKTVILEPTKAQHFYDLARIQQQIGLIPQALSTIDQLLPLITDPDQLEKLQSEKESLQKLVAQNKTPPTTSPPKNQSNITPTISLPDSPSLIQANNNTGLIIASPETNQNQIEVDNLVDANALSDTATLSANLKQLTLNNSNLTSTSQVYLTITKGGKNQTLRLISKSSDSFTVGLDKAIPEDIEFKWWIIN